LILILSCKSIEELEKESFQSWSLAMNGNEGLVSCYDADDNELFKLIIPYTDFPFGEVHVFLMDDVFTLASVS
jgi:hypothetical protein